MNHPKAIVITGANGQTAIRIIQSLLEYDTVLLLLAHKRTERIIPIVKQNSERCFVKHVDLCEYGQIQKAVVEFIRKSGHNPEALIHTAAVRSSDMQTFMESDPYIWQQTFQTNVSMAYNILKCLLQYFNDTQQGRIVLFGSSVIKTGLKQGSAYSAAKAAIINLVKSIALETANTNIRINAISPHPLDTVLEEDYTDEYLRFRKQYFADFLKSSPGAKLVSLDDVADCVLQLLDMKEAVLNGKEIFL